ncbi:hypothetical protein N9458_02385 [Gammaproteobacteria bacterium]|nr:hypothetical protein [Gammaproteobacteria bacterium]
MKKFLALLLISPLTYAEVYTFICVVKDENQEIATIIIDTEKKYIQLGGIVFKTNYNDETTVISASMDDISMSFNKITGIAKQVRVNGYPYVYEYSCRPAKPLIP